MADTPFTRTPRAQLPEQFHLAWDTLNGLTGEPAFVEVFASNPAMLDFVMNRFYAGIFFGGNVDQRYKQLVRLKLSLLHGCRTCNKQNVPGALLAGITQAQVDAMDRLRVRPVHRRREGGNRLRGRSLAHQRRGPHVAGAVFTFARATSPTPTCSSSAP